MAVDDIVTAVVELLEETGVLDNTCIISVEWREEEGGGAVREGKGRCGRVKAGGSGKGGIRSYSLFLNYLLHRIENTQIFFN
jgi:hypothetical protein